MNPEKPARTRQRRWHSIAEITKALHDTKGMVALAARKIGMAPVSLYERIRTTPSLQQVVAEEREALTDTAEVALGDAIINGAPWAITFYLKTQGRKRGYAERHEHSGPDGGPIVLVGVPDLTKLSADELEVLERLLARATPDPA